MAAKRRSGILLHPTSLPGPHGSGDLGLSAITSSTGWQLASKHSGKYSRSAALARAIRLT